MPRMSLLVWFLLGLFLTQPALADEPTSIPRATIQQVHQTVDRAIGYLQTESAAWLTTRKCAACHHVPMPLWALSEAERQGYAIDKRFLSDTIESLLGSKDKLMASKIFPNPVDPPDLRPQGRGLNMGLPFLAVAAQSLPALKEGQKQSRKLITEEIVKKQQSDGSWEFFATLRRPPINESQTTDAAWIIMALAGETGPDAPESQRAALSKAIAWLDAAKRSDIHQDKVMRVLMGARSAKPRKTIQTTIDELLALQRADGGWSQTVPELKCDAFATGQTLYALSLVGLTAERPEIKRGMDFLVATQKPDGSWPMISRSTPDGSPGSAKLLTPITCAASSWATLGLARLAPNEKSASKAAAAGQEPPQWVPISDSVIAKVAGDDNKTSSFERETAGVAVDPMLGDVYMIVNKHGVWKSTDGGKTFARCDGGKVSGRCETAFALNVDPAGNRLACFMLDGKCAWTGDGGKTWQALADVGRNWDFAAVDWSTPEVKHILAGLHESGGQVMLSVDGGKSWAKLFKDREFETTGGLGIFDARTLVYTEKGKGIQRSTDSGATWQKVSDIEPIGRVAQVHKGTAYWLGVEGLLVSKDRGATWSVQGKPVAATIGPMIDPRNEKRIAVAGLKGIARSNDGGETWHTVAAALPKGFTMPRAGWYSNAAWDPVRDVVYASMMGKATYRLERAKP